MSDLTNLETTTTGADTSTGQAANEAATNLFSEHPAAQPTEQKLATDVNCAVVFGAALNSKAGDHAFPNGVNPYTPEQTRSLALQTIPPAENKTQSDQALGGWGGPALGSGEYSKHLSTTEAAIAPIKAAFANLNKDQAAGLIRALNQDPDMQKHSLKFGIDPGTGDIWLGRVSAQNLGDLWMKPGSKNTSDSYNYSIFQIKAADKCVTKSAG